MTDYMPQSHSHGQNDRNFTTLEESESSADVDANQVVEQEGILYAYQDEHGTNTTNLYIISQVMDQQTGQMVNVAIPFDSSQLTQSVYSLNSHSPPLTNGSQHSYGNKVPKHEHPPIAIGTSTTQTHPKAYQNTLLRSMKTTNRASTTSPSNQNTQGIVKVLTVENSENSEITVKEEDTDEDYSDTDEPTTTTEFDIVHHGNHVIVRNSEGTIVNEFSLSQPTGEETDCACDSSPQESFTPLKSSKQDISKSAPSSPVPRIREQKVVVQDENGKILKIEITRQRERSSPQNLTHKSRVKPTSNASCKINSNTVNNPPQIDVGNARKAIISRSHKSPPKKIRRLRSRNKFSSRNCKVIIHKAGPNDSNNSTNEIKATNKDISPSKSLVLSTEEKNDMEMMEVMELVDLDEPDTDDSFDNFELPFEYPGQSFTNESQQLILNIFDFFKRNPNNLSLKNASSPIEQAASVLNLSQSIISKVNEKFTQSKYKFQMPHKIKRELLSNIDSDGEETLKTTIKDFVRRGIIPSVPLLLQAAKEKIGFTGSKTSFRRLLQRMGLKYAKSNKKTVILSIQKEAPAISLPDSLSSSTVSSLPTNPTARPPSIQRVTSTRPPLTSLLSEVGQARASPTISTKI